MAMWNNQMVILFGGEVVHSASHKRGASDLSIPWSTRFQVRDERTSSRWRAWKGGDCLGSRKLWTWVSCPHRGCPTAKQSHLCSAMVAIRPSRLPGLPARPVSSEHRSHAAALSHFFVLMVPTLIFEVFLKFHDLHDDPTDDQALEWFPTRWWSFHDRNCSPCCWGPLYFWNVGLWTGQEPTEPNLTNNNFGFNVWTYWTRGLQQQKTNALTSSKAGLINFWSHDPRSSILRCPQTRQADKLENPRTKWGIF